jgi:hypothetical protein
MCCRKLTCTLCNLTVCFIPAGAIPRASEQQVVQLLGALPKAVKAKVAAAYKVCACACVSLMVCVSRGVSLSVTAEMICCACQCSSRLAVVWLRVLCLANWPTVKSLLLEAGGAVNRCFELWEVAHTQETCPAYHAMTGYVALLAGHQMDLFL